MIYRLKDLVTPFLVMYVLCFSSEEAGNHLHCPASPEGSYFTRDYMLLSGFIGSHLLF